MTLSARDKHFERRNRRLPKSARAEEDPIAGIEGRLDQALNILAFPASLDGYEWGLLASLAVEAEAALREVGSAADGLRPKFDQVVEELRDVTADFTNLEFLRASRAARRDNPELFAPGRGRGG